MDACGRRDNMLPVSYWSLEAAAGAYTCLYMWAEEGVEEAEYK